MSPEPRCKVASLVSLEIFAPRAEDAPDCPKLLHLRLDCQSARKVGSDSHLMILRARLALFHEGNQRHGEHHAFVAPDPGRIGCRECRRGRWDDGRFCTVGCRSPAVPALRSPLRPRPQPISQNHRRSSVCRQKSAFGLRPAGSSARQRPVGDASSRSGSKKGSFQSVPGGPRVSNVSFIISGWCWVADRPPALPRG